MFLIEFLVVHAACSFLIGTCDLSETDMAKIFRGFSLSHLTQTTIQILISLLKSILKSRLAISYNQLSRKFL